MPLVKSIAIVCAYLALKSNGRRVQHQSHHVESHEIPKDGVPVPQSVAELDESSVDNTRPEHLAITVSSEKSALEHGSEHKLLAMLSVKAPPEPLEVRRPAIDLVVCVDRSGSMHGEKMHLMRQTLQLLVKRAGLNGNDRISIVSFDSEVVLELPLQAMNRHGRERAEDVIKKLYAGSTTNLSGGALKAIDVLHMSADPVPESKEGQSRTRAVMLFTDGLANVGITDIDNLLPAVNGALAAAADKAGGPISLYTFGFGADHDENCLRALATGCGTGGFYYYIGMAEDIPTAFADCLGGLTSIVAQNAMLQLDAIGEGVAVTRLLGNTYALDADGAIVLGDLFAEDEKDVLLEISLPELPTPTGPEPVLRARLRAFNVACAAVDVLGVTLEVSRPEVAPVDQSVNELLDAQKNRIEMAEAMEQAALLADTGDLEGGRKVLQNARQRVARSPSALNVLSASLIQQCSDLETQYDSMHSYHTVGSKMTRMHSISHSRQRSSHMNSEMYEAGAKRKKTLTDSWMSSLNGGDGSSDDEDLADDPSF